MIGSDHADLPVMMERIATMLEEHIAREGVETARRLEFEKSLAERVDAHERAMISRQAQFDAARTVGNCLLGALAIISAVFGLWTAFGRPTPPSH